MRVAVTYENGQVFGHFGHAEEIKLYEIEDGQIVSSEVVDTNCSGHSALSGFLVGCGVNVLICGGIGDGAQQALASAGIEIYSGADGDTDAAVESFLRGELESAGVNCDHHSHENEEEEGCGCGCGSSCGSGCGGGCGGGCHSSGPLFEGKNVGKKCKVHYRGTFNDGTQFDSSYDRGETLDFICGMGMMILGFDKAVAEMEVGEKKSIHLMPEEAYGPSDPRAIFTVAIAECPGSEDLSVGEQVYLSDQYGQPVPVTVAAKDDTNITFDANHEMAGKELNFEIELVDCEQGNCFNTL